MTMNTAETGPEPRAEAARWAVSAVFLINGLLYATWAVSIPGVRDALALSEAQVGAALLAIGMGSLLSMPLTGGWTARWGSDRVTAVLAVLAMLSLVPPFLMPNLPALAAALVLLGVFNGGLDVAMNAQGVTVERRLGRGVMSRLHAYFSLGGLLGALLGTVLVGRVPALTHIGLVAALTTLVALGAGRFLLSDRAAPVPLAAHPGGAKRRRPPRFLFSPAVLLLGSLCFLGMLSEGAHYDWAALYFRDVLGVAGGQAGVGYAAFVATMTLGRWFGDRARARFGDERLVRSGALLAAAGLGLALLWPAPLPATLGLAISGLGLSNVVPVLYGAAGHALAGRGIAQVATLGYGGFLLGPPLIGLIAGAAGLSAALAVAVVGAALVSLLSRRAFALLRA
ncbi:Predicted arabinose efflux permease, MFS family [Deinococcus reticulitermitis]|uniref:Predicted arabinose efflux permease, MFS family n=1 Tax=Deinococcus reticulitermitis TaxID=856736 RepID=A0A1H7BA98_9DEIO|nr:Predicted arabinose efflux permease, MFS family [Deinococcus reticulitermitis]